MHTYNAFFSINVGSVLDCIQRCPAHDSPIGAPFLFLDADIYSFSSPFQGRSPGMSNTGVMAGLLRARQNTAPCPGANGTFSSSQSNQQFSLLCGLNSNVNIATVLTAASFTDCMYATRSAILPSRKNPRYGTKCTNKCVTGTSVPPLTPDAPGSPTQAQVAVA